MLALAQHCHQLWSIDFHTCHGLDTDLLDARRTCPLEEIQLKYCHLDRLEFLDQANETASVLADFHRLTKLVIDDTDDYHFNQDPETIHDPSDCTPLLTAQPTAWPHLNNLHMAYCESWTDKMAIQFIQAHPHLQEFHVNYSGIGDRTLDAILKYLPNIRQVNVNGSSRITAAGLCRFVKYCPTSEKGISCEGCRVNMTDNDFPEDFDFDDMGLVRLGRLVDDVVWLAADAIDNYNIPPPAQQAQQQQ